MSQKKAVPQLLIQVAHDGFTVNVVTDYNRNENIFGFSTVSFNHPECEKQLHEGIVTKNSLNKTFFFNFRHFPFKTINDYDFWDVLA